MNHFIVMFVIMIFAGLLSTMSVWADKWEDVRFSINDVYMILLMTGWMILFMGIYYKEMTPALIGALLVVSIFSAIRKQFLVTPDQYLRGMIPHHSMAVHMSRKLIEKGTPFTPFVQNIIDTQEQEILFMRTILQSS